MSEMPGDQTRSDTSRKPIRQVTIGCGCRPRCRSHFTCAREDFVHTICSAAITPREGHLQTSSMNHACDRHSYLNFFLPVRCLSGTKVCRAEVLDIPISPEKTLHIYLMNTDPQFSSPGT